MFVKYLLVHPDEYSKQFVHKETADSPEIVKVESIMDSTKAEEMKTVMIQDILRHLADKQKQTHEPVKVQVMEQKLPEEPTVTLETFDSTHLSKLGRQLLQ